ncbi:MAG: hypothetical protein ACI8S6_002799 [Myxococcota bacterium]|jgi:hypothetical protein
MSLVFVPLTLLLDQATLHYTDDQMTIAVCQARWYNGIGQILAGESSFGGLLDGVILVAIDGDGNEVARQSSIYHQSPMYLAQPILLPTGESSATLHIPLEGITPDQLAQVRLEGGLIGHPQYAAGFVTDWKPFEPSH